MEPVLLAALIVVGGLIALLCVTVPVLIVVGGVYLITVAQQNSLNLRESMRNERAIAKMNLEQYGSADGEGGLDIMDTIESVTELIGGLRNPGAQPAQAQEINENGKTLQQAS